MEAGFEEVYVANMGLYYAEMIAAYGDKAALSVNL